MPSGPGMMLAGVAEPGDVGSLMTAVRDTLQSWIGVGPVFLATADPVSGSFAGTFTFDIPDEAAAAFFAIEMGGRDVVSFRALSRARTPWGSLFAATQARPEMSERWREVMAPLGWGDELRAAVRIHGATWGYLCLHRQSNERPFAAGELARVGALLPAIAGALRRAALSSPVERARLDSGVVLVDGRCRVTGLTGAAEAWLDEMGPHAPDSLPLLLAGLARQVFLSGRPATTTVTTRAGRIGFVEAALLQRAGEPQLAVVISGVPVEYQLERLVAAGGLTARERDVVSCVVRGRSTRAIADELGISPHTVQAHLTAVFSKTGVRSRRELVGRLSG
jgi:DNA-binding CsgD family transcriptional regulator